MVGGDAALRAGAAPGSREAYYAGLESRHVHPLWRQPGLLPPAPRPRAAPHVWRYEEIRPLLLEAGTLVTPEEAERRVLMLMNPGLDGEAAAARNLYAGLQLVLPEEVAPAHRHAASALRFVIEGSGAYTAIDGERQLMEPGDLVLTPNWAWHDHGNDTDAPMIWLDGLDLPLINALEANFFEQAAEESQAPRRPDNMSSQLYARGRLNPTWERWEHRYSPVLNYPWSQTEQVLADGCRASCGSPADGVMFEYTNPFTGGPVLPTLACFVQALAPGQHTDAHRHTTSAIYHVVRGNGRSIVDGRSLTWSEHDTFAVPGWTVHEHVNGSPSQPAILFSFTDEPVMRALDYRREEPAARQDQGTEGS